MWIAVDDDWKFDSDGRKSCHTFLSEFLFPPSVLLGLQVYQFACLQLQTDGESEAYVLADVSFVCAVTVYVREVKIERDTHRQND